MKFYKYHALGNDYIVLDPEQSTPVLNPEQIRQICHRHYGVGSDGILFGPLKKAKGGVFGLKIYNPDGSEAEKSGNGLRIFSRYLWDIGLVREEPFTVETLGGPVQAKVHEDGRLVTVEMGRVSFDAAEIPVRGVSGEAINQQLSFGDELLTFHAATIGNPHCVIVCDELNETAVRQLGPFIETHEIFPNRTNVQFLKVLDRDNIQIEIWERGAGYTLASGSSASASAAVAHRLGLCNTAIIVHMPGGQLGISIEEEYQITMTGPVTPVAEGMLYSELFETKL